MDELVAALVPFRFVAVGSRTGVWSFSLLLPLVNVMGDTREDNQPYESELYGDATAAGATRFGYGWRDRTYGLGAVKIEWDDKGVHSLATVLSTVIGHPIFKTRFVSSQTVSWFKLKEGEYFTEILFRESTAHGKISALCFRTNMRRSQWHGSDEGTERTITAAPGYYIHSIHGSQEDGVCRTLGAYFVPLSLRVREGLGPVWVADSKVIGGPTVDIKSNHCFVRSPRTISAIVVTISEELQRVRVLVPVEYGRYLAVTKSALGRGDNMLVFADGELITALRACLKNDRVSAIQFETTLGTTEWFGPLPGPGDLVETRSIRDEPTATHIGGIFGMNGPDHITSIGVKFCKQE